MWRARAHSVRMRSAGGRIVTEYRTAKHGPRRADHGVMTKLIMMAAALCLLVSCAGEHSHRPQYVTCGDPAPSDDDVELLRWHVERARRALPGLPALEREDMAQRIRRAEDALDRLDRALGTGSWCTKGKGYLFVAGAAVVADDATGVGAVDDIALPFLAVAALALHLMTEAPAPPAELQIAWGGVVGALDAIGRRAETLKSSPPIPLTNCVEHVGACLETPLGAKNSGGSWGSSICHDCLRLCESRGTWPFATGAGKDCSWWRRK